MIYPVTISEKSANMNIHIWEPKHMKDLKDIKEAIVSYSMHSPYVRQLLNT